LLGDVQDVYEAAGQYAQLQTDSGFRTMLSLMLPQLRLDAQAIKLQYNAGEFILFIHECYFAAFAEPART